MLHLMDTNIIIESNAIIFQLVKPQFRLLLNECHSELHYYFKNEAAFKVIGNELLINTKEGWQFYSRNLPFQILEFEQELNRKILELLVDNRV